MSKLNSILAAYALAAMTMSDDLGSNDQEKRIKPKETEEERKVRLVEAEIKRYKAQGLTEFFYGENSLWALNKKSADKKARQRNWL